jgi:hypothetical protein
MTGCLNVPKICLPDAEIDLTLPAWTSWMKLTYEICTGDELPPQAARVSATSTATTRAVGRTRTSREVRWRVLVIVTEVSTTVNGTVA